MSPGKTDHPHHNHVQPRSWWRQVHKDWRAWVAVVLMLAGMLAYVLSFDESLQPAGNDQPAVPAAP